MQIAPDNGYLKHLLARTLTFAGEPERAIDALQGALDDTSYHITPAMVRIDPTFDPLRKNPRFQKLVAGK